ncbi:MAG: hypothetical protein IJ413_10100 [Bacteroides sp.]|nr:hypothetical protein [Bacteroides sp.]
MKKCRIGSGAIMGLALLLSACSSNDLDEHALNGDVRQLIVSAKDFVIDESDVSSRTNIDPSKGFSWASNDTIGIFPEKGDQLPFAMASGTGTKVAFITGGSWGLKTSQKYASYYPFSRQNYFTDRANILFSYVGQEQTGDNSTEHLGAYDLMSADNAEADGDNLNFSFVHLGCILRMYVTVPNAGTYSSLTLSVDEKAFASKVKLDLTKTPAELTAVESSKTITLSLKDFTTPSDNYQTTLFLITVPFDLAGKTITLKLKSANGYIYSGTFSPSKAYVAQMMYNLRFTSLTKDSAPSIGIGGEFETSDEEM